MKLRYRIEYNLVRGLLAVCRCLPEVTVFALFRGLGMLSYHLLSRRRHTAYLNTGVVFPHKSRAERLQLVRAHFLHMAESLALNTMIMSGRISNERLMKMVEVDHWERMDHAVKHSPHGVLFISAHIGDWELMAQYAALRLGIATHIIARETDNPLLEQHIMLPLRERFGIKIFYKKNALRNIFQATRKGEPAGILIDQKLSLRQGITNDFFGRPAGTTPTPAVLQIRFGIVTMPIFMVYVARRHYKMVVGEPVVWNDNGRPFEEQVAELTAIHQKKIEEIILEYPEQWFWVHDRWGLWKQRKNK